MAIATCIVCKDRKDPDKPGEEFPPREANVLCSVCQSGRHCSQECLQTDLALHNLMCGGFSRFDFSARLSTNHFRAFPFPADSTVLRVVGLEGNNNEPPNVDAYLNTGIRPYPYPVGDEKATNATFLAYREGSQDDKHNASIAAINHTKPGLKYSWTGSVIAYGKNGLDPGKPAVSRHLDMNDYRHVAEEFLTTMHKPMPDLVEGVVINRDENVEYLNKPRFQRVSVPSTHCIFSSGDTSPIADRIGLPIFTQNCAPDPPISNKRTHSINQDAKFLHLCIHPSATICTGKDSKGNAVFGGWSEVPAEWDEMTGDVLVVRQDKKRLRTADVEALCKYCRFDCLPLMMHSNGKYGADEPLSKDAVLSMICRSTFSISWQKTQDRKNEKEEGGWEWNSPYNLLNVRDMGE